MVVFKCLVEKVDTHKIIGLLDWVKGHELPKDLLGPENGRVQSLCFVIRKEQKPVLKVCVCVWVCVGGGAHMLSTSTTTSHKAGAWDTYVK